MVQFVFASHGRYAQEAVNSAQMIYGSIPESIHVISLLDGAAGIDQFQHQAEELAAAIGDAPVILLVDLFGASPFMTLLSAFRNTTYKLITGFNLPMVLEAMQCEADDLEGTVCLLLESGQAMGIQTVDKIIVQEETEDD